MPGLCIDQKAGTVRTVSGDIGAGTLGYCQCHEHLFIQRGRPAQINPAMCMEDLDKAAHELDLYRSAGGNAIVDAQPIGCGRMAGALREASARSGVQIVASTGFHKLAFYPSGHPVFHDCEEKLADLFIREIKDGMADDGPGGGPALPPGCRAGVIKAALDAGGFAGRYEELFGAVTAAALATGAAVMLHVEAGADALQALKFFTGKSVSTGSLIFCHLDRTDGDTGRHREIAMSGAFLEYDTIGRFKYHSDEHEIGLIENILAAGLGDRLLMSLDTTRERLISYGGSPGLDYIRKVFIPKLRARGIGEAQIIKMTVDNPAAALTIRLN